MSKKTIKAMKRAHYFLTEDQKHFVYEVNCTAPMIAIKMHEHKMGHSHVTEVISGAIEIHDGSKWKAVVRAGETIDLSENNLTHEILAIENNTTFRNIVPSNRQDEQHMLELIKVGIIEEEDLTRDRVIQVEKYSYSIENSNILVLTVLGSMKSNHSRPRLSFNCVNDNNTCMILDYTCDEGNDTEVLVKITERFEITNELKTIKIKWNEGKAETIINLFP